MRRRVIDIPDPELSDEQWQMLAPWLPDDRGSRAGGPKPTPNRAVLEGILWVLRNGARWNALPREDPADSPCWRPAPAGGPCPAGTRRTRPAGGGWPSGKRPASGWRSGGPSSTRSKTRAGSAGTSASPTAASPRAKRGGG